MHILF
jgi:sucrose synthase